MLRYHKYGQIGIKKGTTLDATVIIATKCQQHMIRMSIAAATTIKCHYVNVNEKEEAKRNEQNLSDEALMSPL